jgi:hypothetical protein
MRGIELPFELVVDERTVRVSEHDLAGKRVFHVDYGSGLRPLVITVGISSRDKKFWTSIPEGRQAEAERIGKLIGEYIRGKKNS